MVSLRGSVVTLSCLALGLASVGCTSDSEDATADAGAVTQTPGVDGGPITGVFDSGVPFTGLPGVDGSVANPGAASGIPCDVQPLVTKYCSTCHGAKPQFGATAALASYADFQAASVSAPTLKRYQVAHTRLSETNTALKMPPTSQPQPSASELATLDAWLNAGAPQATASCGGGTDGGVGTDGGAPPDASTGPIDTTGLECYKLLAHASGSSTNKFKVGSARDAYYNFSFKAPWTGTAYGVVVRPVIDNSAALHHWLLFQQNGGVTDGQVQSSSGAHPSGELVYGWAPGGNGLDFRSAGNVGFEFPQGTGFTVEFHYNSSDASAMDASGVEVCVQKNKPANIAGVSWLGTDAIIGTTEAVSTCTPQKAQSIHILGVSPHMHLKGKHMKGIINRQGGTKETLHDGDFSFQDQTWYKKDVVLNAGDTITTTCTWSSPATFGKGTSDEMCYLFTVAYPKNALSDGGFQGTLTHGGGACLGL